LPTMKSVTEIGDEVVEVIVKTVEVIAKTR
jgi:hypothetical protein